MKKFKKYDYPCACNVFFGVKICYIIDTFFSRFHMVLIYSEKMMIKNKIIYTNVKKQFFSVHKKLSLLGN